MALKMEIKRSENNLRALFSSGYFRITDVRVRKEQGNVEIQVAAYADEEARRFVDAGGSSMPNMPGPMMNNGSKIKDENFTVTLAQFNDAVVPDGTLPTDELMARAYVALRANIVKFNLAVDA
jgi:hypothetical protein